MEKLKSSICFSCCFRGTDVEPLAHEYPTSAASAASAASASGWAPSKATQISELKERYGSRGGTHRRRNSAGNFGYDPLSYALNFDDGGEISPAEYRYRNFCSRFPATPPAKEEVTCR